eukprot:g3624.t1
MLSSALNYWTSLRELKIAMRSERIAWNLVDEKLYENSILHNVRNRKGRAVRIVRFEPTMSSSKSMAKPRAVLLFVHGSMARFGQFRYLMEMAREKKDLAFVAYDFFGMGRSPKPTSDAATAYTTEELMNDLVDIYTYTRNRFAPDIPVILVAHSYGCSLALKFVLSLGSTRTRPPDAMVLLGAYRWDASTSRSKTMRRLFGLPLWFLRAIRTKLSSGFKTRAFAPETLTDRALEPVLRYAEAISGMNPFHVVQPFYLSSASQTITIADLVDADSRRIMPPLFFATGEKDKLTPPSEARKLSDALPKSSRGVVVVPRAGHQVMEERPSLVFDVIEKAASVECASKRAS